MTEKLSWNLKILRCFCSSDQFLEKSAMDELPRTWNFSTNNALKGRKKWFQRTKFIRKYYYEFSMLFGSVPFYAVCNLIDAIVCIILCFWNCELVTKEIFTPTKSKTTLIHVLYCVCLKESAKFPHLTIMTKQKLLWIWIEMRCGKRWKLREWEQEILNKLLKTSIKRMFTKLSTQRW